MNTDLSIMIIDDNHATNLYHKIMIEDAGISLENLSEFNSACEAVMYLDALISENKTELFPKIILLDINMPIMNGWDFIAQLKKMEFGNHTPDIYMVSNSRHPMDIANAEEEPLIAEICEKPLSVNFFMSLANAEPVLI